MVPHDARSAALVRSSLGRELGELAIAEEVAEAAELLLSELIGNSIRHARPLPGGVLRITWEIGADLVTLRVTDGGSASGRCPQPRVVGLDSDSGRGLSIVQALAAAWGVEPNGVGQSVWAVLANR
jgi:two-component sensor histidine kinase